MDTFFSILIPAYNVKPHTDERFASTLAQNFESVATNGKISEYVKSKNYSDSKLMPEESGLIQKHKSEPKNVFLIDCFGSGGAEHIISMLANASAEKGINTEVILTHQKLEDSMRRELSPNVKLISVVCEPEYKKIQKRLLWNAARLLEKTLGKFNKNAAEYAYILKFKSRNYGEYYKIRRIFNQKNLSAISFLNHSIFLSVLAKRKCNRLIISERVNPHLYTGNKTTMAFIHKLYKKSDYMVFQTEDAKKWYEANSNINGKVIFNPVKGDLPAPFEGERQNVIFNFCRICDQKNLPLLVNAFANVYAKHPQYKLLLIGDACTEEEKALKNSLFELARQKGMQNSFEILPFMSNIHSYINDLGIFVSSSDYEGMSNSMLEAMAMGIPSICTDCPIGGARAIISNGENGILVPVGDVAALSEAMEKLIQNKELQNKLSKNAANLRTTLSAERILQEWFKIIR